MTQAKSTRSLFFRARLAALLAERGISQRELAAASQLTPQSISNYVRGSRRLPGAEELYILARYFNVSMESLLGPDNNQETPVNKKATSRVPVPPAKLRRIVKQVERLIEELQALIEEIKEFTA